MKPESTLLGFLCLAPLCSNAVAQLPDGLVSRTFYDTTKVRFDGIMWFEEIPGKPGTFLVAEQSGKIWTFQPATSTKTKFMDFPAYYSVEYYEDGLLGLAFHPKFLENRKIYVYYSPVESHSNLVIGEITTDPTFLKDSGTPVKKIFSIPMMGSHHGATVAFGPDGYLYFAKGQDHGQIGTAQDLKNARGKMFRLDVDHPDPGKAYGIPSDNPFFASTDGTLKEIWAYGLRNPMKFSFDALNGDLWETEVGQWFFEDVNLIRKGSNLGWDIREGLNCYSWSNERKPLASCNHTGMTDPIWSIPHINPSDPWGNSGTGGFVYRANAASKFYGSYFFGDFCSKQMFAMTQKNGVKSEVKEYARLPLGPIHFAVASDGKVYFAGWYNSSQNLTKERSSQILMIDHPELSLGATAVRFVSASRRTKAGSGIYKQLNGLPVGVTIGRDAQGRELRTYGADRTHR